MGNFIVTVQDLHKSYGVFEAVKGLSFQIERGEIFGLLGPNGAGKTTTISMLTGLTAPTNGRITIDSLNMQTQANQAKRKIGLVPQELALYPTLSAEDNLKFFGRIYGLRGKKLNERIAATLDIVGLSERAKSPIEKFSGGMKRRINIAAGLLHEPEILFLDEPTVGVDPQSRNAIFESIEALHDAGMTVIYTTHYMEEAQRLCDRIAIMDEGKLLALDTPSALINGLGGGLIRLGLENGHRDAVAAKTAVFPSIKTVERQNGHLLIEAHQPQTALLDVLSVTNQLDAHVTSLQVFEPNLETVFLHLTGKQLRD